MEDYFVADSGTYSPTCSSSSDGGILTQTCTLSENMITGEGNYLVNQTLLNSATDLNLTALFSTNVPNQGLVLSMNPIFATANLGMTLPSCNPCHIFVTNGLHDGNFGSECVGAGCATSLESGIRGADTLCQAEATTNNIAGIYKAIILASTRYPCDASGECGASHMSNWVINSNTVYQNLLDEVVGTSTANYVLPQLTWPSYADGTTTNGDPVFTGISVGRVNAGQTDIDAWSPFNINSSVPGYSLQNCNDWTSADVSIQAVSAAPSGFFGTNGDALNWYAGWGNGSSYYVYSQWLNSAQVCDNTYALICAQQ